MLSSPQFLCFPYPIKLPHCLKKVKDKNRKNSLRLNLNIKIYRINNNNIAIGICAYTLDLDRNVNQQINITRIKYSKVFIVVRGIVINFTLLIIYYNSRNFTGPAIVVS